MVEVTYGLPYKYNLRNYTTAICLIDAQLEKINLQATFAKEQDLLEVIRILHATRVEVGGEKTLDLELLFNQICGLFEPDEEAPEDDGSLQAALAAQVRKTNYKCRGAHGL